MTVVRAAVVQAGSVPFEREKCLEKVQALTADAAKQGAQLVVFPEAFVSAYPWGASFGATVGTRTDEGREEFRRYFGGVAGALRNAEAPVRDESIRRNGSILGGFCYSAPPPPRRMPNKKQFQTTGSFTIQLPL